MKANIMQKSLRVIQRRPSSWPLERWSYLQVSSSASSLADTSSANGMMAFHIVDAFNMWATRSGERRLPIFERAPLEHFERLTVSLVKHCWLTWHKSKLFFFFDIVNTFHNLFSFTFSHTFFVWLINLIPLQFPHSYTFPLFL